MPVLAYRGYAGNVPILYPKPQLPWGLVAKFEKVEIFYNSIAGRLHISSHAYNFDGIKIRLQSHLKLAKEGKNDCAEIDMFQQYPIETMFEWSGTFRGRRKLDFEINFPKELTFPDPFINSYGSLTYRLVVLMSIDDRVTWKPIASKLLLNFKGYHNFSDVEVHHPTIDGKRFLDGKISSIFTINKPVLLVGRDKILKATLHLETDLDYELDVTVTLLRKKRIGEIDQTDVISRQRQQIKFHDRSIIFEWNLDASTIATVTYANESVPMYSVRYFAKYKASFKQLTTEGSSDQSVFGRGDGIVEVKVGTAFDSGTDSTKITEHLKQLSLGSRSTSVSSMFTLPPAYSALSSRIGSFLSLETQPPTYDDLNETESLL